MGTAVDAVGSLSWSSLLAQCTHPSAAVMLAAKGTQLSLCSEELPLAEPGAAWTYRFFQGGKNTVGQFMLPVHKAEAWLQLRAGFFCLVLPLSHAAPSLLDSRECPSVNQRHRKLYQALLWGNSGKEDMRVPIKCCWNTLSFARKCAYKWETL